jgi:hypothetical protein
MKLGTQTNSLTNHLYSRMVIGQPEPAVGMGATILAWTERYPATIAKIIWSGLGHRMLIEVQEDKATRVDNRGMCESQEWSYESNPNGCKRTFRRSASGCWQEVTFNERTKRWNKTEGHGLRIGEREKYYDFSF